VVDSAISVYNTIILCTMMADYDMVPEGVSKRLADEMSRLLEEGEKRIQDINAKMEYTFIKLSIQRSF